MAWVDQVRSCISWCVIYVRVRPQVHRGASRYKPSTTGATTAPVVSSVASKDPPSASSNFKTSNSSNNLSDYYRIYKPSNGGLIISQKGGNFTRTGSFSNRQIQPQPTLASQTGSGLGSKPESTFMRSFSFRKREANDEHHSSMPCLNANFRFVFCLFVYLS